MPDSDQTTLSPWATPHVPFRDYAAVLACLSLGLTLLVVVLMAQQHTRVMLFLVLPAVLITMACSSGVGLWLLVRGRLQVWALLAAPAVAGALGMFSAVLLLATIHGRSLPDVFGRHLVAKGLMASPILGAMVGLSLYLLARARQRELEAWEQELSNRLDIERLQRERALADLQLLQAQIEPHFLYNTLANLRQLIRKDSTRALSMLEQLIKYFKLVLPSFRSERLPLLDEVALVEAYLELLRERLDRGIRLTLQVPMEWHAVTVLPGALLCLAENAVKHGLPEADGAELTLHIAASHEGDSLLLSVQDNGPGLYAKAHAESTGTGLRNLRERLRLRYGDRASLRMQDNGAGCKATLELPWEAP